MTKTSIVQIAHIGGEMHWSGITLWPLPNVVLQPKQAWPIEVQTPPDPSKCAVVSGTRMVAADPCKLSVSCEVRSLQLGLVCPAQPTDFVIIYWFYISFQTLVVDTEEIEFVKPTHLWLENGHEGPHLLRQICTGCCLCCAFANQNAEQRTAAQNVITKTFYLEKTTVMCSRNNPLKVILQYVLVVPLKSTLPSQVHEEINTITKQTALFSVHRDSVSLLCSFRIH